MPSYGPEMRGGTANCIVTVSSDEISSPIIGVFDTVVALNQPSLDKFEEAVKPGGTTKDLKFTLETVNCVGACAMAPVVSLNGKYHGNVQPGKMLKTIKGGKKHARK